MNTSLNAAQRISRCVGEERFQALGDACSAVPTGCSPSGAHGEHCTASKDLRFEMNHNTECRIRTARRADVPAIARLADEFARYMRGLGDSSDLRLDAAALERDGFGSDPAFRGVVAELRGEVVGFLLHHAGYDTDAACRLLFVVDLFVTEAARSRGVGVALMNEARAIAVASGAKQIVWTVDRRNAVGMRFYEHIGARYVDGLELMYLDA